jgi:hypothetical protein
MLITFTSYDMGLSRLVLSEALTLGMTAASSTERAPGQLKTRRATRGRPAITDQAGWARFCGRGGAEHLLLAENEAVAAQR